MTFLTSLVSAVIVLFARFITAVRGVWIDEEGPNEGPLVYFSNHASHGDFVLIWTVLPPHMRQKTRPVAGADYWLTSTLRRFIGKRVFDAVLIERDRDKRSGDPVAQMAAALDDDASLILFPEGTRNTTVEVLLSFKSGLYHLARMRPDIPLVPVWIENLNRVMPKGEIIPIPLVCTVTFGSSITIEDGESKETFLKRTREALLALREQVVGDETENTTVKKALEIPSKTSRGRSGENE